MKNVGKFKEPKTIGLVMTAISGCILGSCLAVSILMSTPVTRAPAKAGGEDLSNFRVNYAPGITSGAESESLKIALRRLENQLKGDISFSEGDVNFYLKQFASGPGSESNVSLGAPNINLSEERSVIGIPVVVDPSGQNIDLMFQMHGHFELSEGGPTFITDDMYVNSLRIPFIGGLLGAAFTDSISQASHPEKLVLAWKTISKVVPSESALTFTVGEET